MKNGTKEWLRWTHNKGHIKTQGGIFNVDKSSDFKTSVNFNLVYQAFLKEYESE